MTKAASEATQLHLSPQEVVGFLKSNPDFFSERTELLTELVLPHESGTAASLIERQVAVLRKRSVQLRRQLNELLAAARSNDVLFAKVRTLTLALLDVSAWHELNEVLATHLLADFDADFVCCHLAGARPNLDHLLGHANALPTAALLRNAQPACSALRAEELKRIFPMQDHEEAGSAVLVPLPLRSGEGCLAVGSRDPGRFTADMDTLFVGYIGDVLARIIDRLELQAVR